MIVLLADAHLPYSPELDRDPAWIALRGLFDMLSEGDRLYVLGDLFDCWIEYGPGRYPLRYRPVVEKLLEVLQRGVDIALLVGNHDAWTGTFWPHHGVRLRHGPIQETFYGEPVWLAHGHEWPHRGWRYRILLHPVPNRLYRLLLPEPVGLELAARIARLLRRRGKDPDRNHMDPRYRAACALAGSGKVRHIVCAHTHYPKRLPLPGGGWYWNVGAWMETRTLLLWDETGPRLCRWSEQGGLLPWEEESGAEENSRTAYPPGSY